MSHYTDNMVEDGMMSDFEQPSALKDVPLSNAAHTTPAPMTAERAATIAREWRDVLAAPDDGSSACNMVRELWRERAALTARIAVLEAELAAARKAPESGEVHDALARVFSIHVYPPEAWTLICQNLERVITRQAAALAEAKDTAHYANGVADLAMKHRNEAETELASLQCEYEKLRCLQIAETSVKNELNRLRAIVRAILA